MSLQTIIDNATYVEVDVREISGSTLSRSGRYKTADRNINIYQFRVGMHDGLTYSDNRSVLQAIYNTGSTNEANVSLNNNSNMQYLTDYKGNLSQAQLDQLTCSGFSNSAIYINTHSVTGSPSGTLFKAGDYIQPLGNTNGYRYPYQVTTDVIYSAGANIGVEVHRPVISQDGVSLTGNAGIRVGNDVRFHVKITNLPKYSVVPHDRLSFSDDFDLIEVIS